MLMQATMQAELQEKREIAVDVEVKAPTVQSVDVTVAVAAKSGYAFAEVQAAVEQSVTAFFTGTLLGKPVRLAELGVAPVSSVANVLSIKFTFMSFGTWFILWNILLFLVQLIILGREFKPAMIMQVPVAVIFGWFNDLTRSCIDFITPSGYISRLILVAMSIICIALGVALMVLSDTTVNPPDAFVRVVAGKLKKNFGDVKVAFDVSSVALAVILSLIFFDLTVVGTREGTVIIAVCTGFVVKFFTKLLKAPMTKILDK